MDFIKKFFFISILSMILTVGVNNCFAGGGDGNDKKSSNYISSEIKINICDTNNSVVDINLDSLYDDLDGEIACCQNNKDNQCYCYCCNCSCCNCCSSSCTIL